MAIINCPECSKELSDNAMTCPHCGYVLKKSPNNHPIIKKKKSNLLAVVLIVAIVILAISFYFEHLSTLIDRKAGNAKEPVVSMNNSMEAGIKEAFYQNSELTRKEKEANQPINETQLKALDNAISSGFVRLSASPKGMYITAKIWNELDTKEKENLSRSAAIRIAKGLNSDLIWCDVYDLHSGKKVAQYSDIWGLKVYTEK